MPSLGLKIATLSAGALPGSAVFWGSRSAAHAYLCSCPGSRASATLACACLGLFVTFGLAEWLLRRYGPSKSPA